MEDQQKQRRRTAIVGLIIGAFIVLTLSSFVFAIYQQTIAKTNERLAVSTANNARQKALYQANVIDQLLRELEKCQASKK